MKILQICPRVPYPLHDGGAIGIFNITKHLALRGHQVKMVAFGTETSAAAASLRQFCELFIVQHQTSSNRIEALRSLASKVPYTMSKYHTPAMFAKLVELVEHYQIEVVHVDLLHMAIYGIFLKERYGLPIVLREHNVELTIMERFTENQKNPLLRWYATLQHQKLLRYEPEICAQFDYCAMITREDEQRIRALSNQARTTIIPAGVDLPALADSTPEESRSILFLASLDWLPNVDGFFWFYKNVLPQILREEPEVRVSIVGKGYSARLQNLRHPNIRFIGFVEDVTPHLQAAQVCIVPLFAGGGMRIKILEMFSHRKSVVSTSVGCEGIAAAHGQDLLVADEASEFARSVVRALRDKELRLSLGNNARRLVERKYDWKQIGAAFEKVYHEIIH
ncbi:glycosyltransferase family 4 protein [candidate division KSB1 bacterium]|nr:glycosyltransferase family 4 protein [candidate division KSB1 bacterium]